MTCGKCKVKMKEQKRSYHKKRKWICPKCGAVKMEPVKPRDRSQEKTGESVDGN